MQALLQNLLEATYAQIWPNAILLSILEVRQMLQIFERSFLQQLQ